MLQGFRVDVHPTGLVHQGAGSDDVRGRHRWGDVQEVVLRQTNKQKSGLMTD